MSALDEFADSLAEIRGEIPESFTWNGKDYDCFANGATKGGKLEDFGFATYADHVFVVEGSLFGDGARPERGQKVTSEGKTYRIDTVLTAPGSVFLRLVCVHDSSGA